MYWTNTFAMAYPGIPRITPTIPNILPATNNKNMIVSGWTFIVFPMTFGEMKFPSKNCTIAHTIANFTSIHGDVTSAIIIAGVIAMIGPKYGTTLVIAAIIAKTIAYSNPIIK